MPIPEWVAQYIGIPFVPYGRDRNGCDCWGLLRLVYAEQFGIDLPIFADKTWNNPPSEWDAAQQSAYRREQRRELAELMGAHITPWKKVNKPKVGTGILLKYAGAPIHVGIVVDPMAGRMLHVFEGTETCVEYYSGIVWGKSIVGFYEWDS